MHSIFHYIKFRPSLPRSRQATGLLIQRAIKEANQSVTTIPRKRSESQEQIEAIPSRLEASTERRVQLKRSKAQDPTALPAIDEVATSRAFEKEARESGDEAHTSITVSKKRKVGAQVFPLVYFLFQFSISLKYLYRVTIQ